VRTVAAAERDAVVGLATRLRAAGLAVPTVGVGSTPTCCLPPPHLDGVDEMHPGNYLYFDVMQATLGSCSVDDVAVRVLTRVVGNYAKSNTLLVDCGWTGASAQGADAGYGGFPDHPELRIAQLKQECGEVTTVDGSPLDFGKYPIGALLEIAPHHACAATHQHARVHVLADDNATITDSWRICKGWG
jgi:D-serine deaminase-like pyridoxal phosphate-dependent protein